jgi:hypothetical protein
MVLGIVLLLAVAAGGYWLGTQKSIPVAKSSQPTPLPTKVVITTPTVDPTAGWKEYRDKGNHFSFKYPLEWSVSSRNQPVEEVAFLVNNTFLLGVRLDQNLKKLTLKQWLDQSFNSLPGILKARSQRQETILSGLPAEKVFIPGEGEMWQVVTLKEDYFLTFSQGNALNADTFSQILGTFRFLE